MIGGMQHRWTFSRGRVGLAEAWTGAEVRAAVPALLEFVADRLPADRGAAVVIKPNLNNDLPALTGNSADLRVLEALLGALVDRGYRDLTVADGPNVGVERRGIDAFRRLRVDRIAARHGARVFDLNHDEGRVVALHGGGRPRVARTILDAACYISVPKVKTHAEAGLSCALKNQVGITVGQDKRHMHRDLARNIFALSQHIRPHLVLVDGLVGMEGNGPGDGDPFRLGRLVVADDPLVNDLAVCRMVGLDLSEVPYLVAAREAGALDAALVAEIAAAVPLVRAIRRPPSRSRLAKAADVRALGWLKRAARPITDRPEVTTLAYDLGVIQDVYAREDDGVTGLTRDASRCGTCDRCVDFCPTGLPLAEIGVTADPARCVGCLYCWWVCPKDAIALDGPLGQLTRQIARYKADLERL